jgi:SAM-dependent methyltransferase
MLVKAARRLVRGVLQRTDHGSAFLMRRTCGVTGPHGRPDAPWCCAVLRSVDEVQKSVDQVRRLGLPPVGNLPKNWDSLAALDVILRSTNSKALIFDAGGEKYSMILPWLALYGYRHLIVGNQVFGQSFRKGPIVYEHADIVETRFPDGALDAVTCLSVIEHGVDIDAYFREMSRILRVGGLLITSTDYFETPVDTGGRVAFGAPIRVFTKDDIGHALEVSAHYGFELVSPLDLHATEKVVYWKDYDLRYTFAIISLRKGR